MEVPMRAWRTLALGAALLGSPGLAAITESFHSDLLKREVRLVLHEPSAAVQTRWRSAHTDSPMRLVLFLPGAYDGPEDFVREGLDTFLADQEDAGALPPSLWVAVAHFQGWYADRRDGTFPYERFLLEELIPAIEARHPGFGGSTAARSVTGLSMGGFGALNLAARSGAFSKCLSLSPALVEPPFQRFPWLTRRSLRRVFPEDVQAFTPWNPWKHLGGAAELAIACGTEDKYHLAEVCRTFAALCEKQHRPLRLELSAGGHDWAYWTPAFKRWTPWLLDIPTSRGRP
jgi:enterochelin esterase-like enzyme